MFRDDSLIITLYQGVYRPAMAAQLMGGFH